jgi:CHAD domain-containing protein
MAITSDPDKGIEAGSHPVDRGELVHETRKTIKRMRALARLLRHELGEQEFMRVNSSLRDAGQRLAGARDAEVRLATLERLRARNPQALALHGVERLSEQLERERVRTGEPTSLGEVLEDIADMRQDLANWNLVDPDFETLAPGLKRIYREGRRRYRRVRRERNAEQLHDWRKRVKSLYYALDMLGGSTATKRARRATRRAEDLGDLLGEEHDLWMLHAYLEQHPGTLEEDRSAHEQLLKLIERRRRRLRKRALKLGARLYRRKARAFTQRVSRAFSR